MLNIKLSILNAALLIITLNSCNTPQVNVKEEQPPSTTANYTDSTKLLSENIKKAYPDFDLKLDSSKVDTTQYAVVDYPDTTQCGSFRLNRVFLGKLDKVKAIVQEYGSAKKLYLQSGNLNLWLCNLPQKIKAGDTVIITGFVYNILGNEKTWGYPTILTEVRRLPI